MTTAYPLSWPDGWARTPADKRRDAPFKVTIEKAQQELIWEVERMGGRYPLISCSVPVRRKDGWLYTDGKPADGDPGVAVYFEIGGQQKVFACDRWKTVRDNIRAVHKTIEALRGIDRWGASQMLERALSAFDALPPPRTCWDVLGIPRTAPREQIEAAYRAKARTAHPDAGGSTAAMAELNAARDAAIKEIGG